MPQVDFYVLETTSPKARWEFVARLLNKLQGLGKTALIAVESTEEAKQLDALLWAHPPESFLPHGLESELAEPEEPFVISAQPGDSIKQDVFVNLRKEVPASHRELQRLIEVVIQEGEVLAATRENFRFYREQGYPIQSHTMGSV